MATVTCHGLVPRLTDPAFLSRSAPFRPVFFKSAGLFLYVARQFGARIEKNRKNFEPSRRAPRPIPVSRRYSALQVREHNVSRFLKCMLTFVSVSVKRVPSPIALDFWQPLPACYGQAISGDDEIIFQYRSHLFSV
ncbi:hypothetical protein [Nioella sediminis]|uniref:hypothetical protein n=1 Tax=Nioella sediminis TaxID=1912092 RepID=UPI00103C4D06|nr:hypothetical protein [Nioella sediminis]